MVETATSPPSRMPPTPRQARILQFILDFTMEHGFQPSMREIQAFMNYGASNNGVVCHFNALIRKGYLAPRPRPDGPGTGGTSRALQILRLPDGSPFKGFTLK